MIHESRMEAIGTSDQKTAFSSLYGKTAGHTARTVLHYLQGQTRM